MRIIERALYERWIYVLHANAPLKKYILFRRSRALPHIFLFTFFPAASVNIENPAPAPPPPPPRWKKIKAELWWIIPERGGLIGNTASVRPSPSPASLPNWVNIILYNNRKTETSYFFLSCWPASAISTLQCCRTKYFLYSIPDFSFIFFYFKSTILLYKTPKSLIIII